jgi:hypothetical protein
MKLDKVTEVIDHRTFFSSMQFTPIISQGKVSILRSIVDMRVLTGIVNKNKQCYIIKSINNFLK